MITPADTTTSAQSVALLEYLDAERMTFRALSLISMLAADDLTSEEDDLLYNRHFLSTLGLHFRDECWEAADDEEVLMELRRHCLAQQLFGWVLIIECPALSEFGPAGQHVPCGRHLVTTYVNKDLTSDVLHQVMIMIHDQCHADDLAIWQEKQGLQAVGGDVQ